MIDGHAGRIANIDISPIVIDYMRAKYSAGGTVPNALPDSVTWEVADVTALEAHASASFDAAVDKGTMDALMVSVARVGARVATPVFEHACIWCRIALAAQCGGDSTTNVAAMAREMSRVLRPGGVYILVRRCCAASFPALTLRACTASPRFAN